MKDKYIKTGKCIWCGRQEPEVTFYTAPHIVPKSLGGKEIGFDICDDCNHTFGTAPRQGVPSVDLCFKEIFNAFKTFTGELNANTYKNFHSIFFSYYHDKHLIKINKYFKAYNITRQFKRGLYEVFLQKYHYSTKNGNHAMFNSVRNFARYDKGDLHVYYAFNNVILSQTDENQLKIEMTDQLIEKMMEYGIYCFWMASHIFYLEIFPAAFISKGSNFLQKEANSILIPALGNEQIFEVKDITQTDFFMQRFNSTEK